MMIINWIDFGQVSAERDDNLSNYFFENGVLQSAIASRYQFLILGRKGAGKTAVFQHFRDNPNKYIPKEEISISMSLQNYSWDVHGLLVTDGKASSLAYIQSWKYVIYLMTIKELGAQEKLSGKLKKASRIIEKIYTSPTPTLAQVIGQKLLQLSHLKLPSGGLDLDDDAIDALSIQGGEITFNNTRDDASLQAKLNQSVERITDIFEDALLDGISSHQRIFVSFDRIDEAWDAASFESSQRIIAGLIGAAEYINSKFSGKLRPLVFLREDIFETLDINDKNKLRSDCGQLLAWKKDGLSRMILERVNYFARSNGQKEISKVDELFDKDQMRQQRAPFDHIMLRTMLRPRVFIKMFQLIKKDMIERRDDPFNEEEINSAKLECQAIYNVEPAYSEWLVEELRDEWRAQFPMINKLLEAIQNIGRTNFTGDDLRESLHRLSVLPSPGEMNTYMKFLFDNSIIGFRVGKSNQWRYKCFFSSQGFVESEIYKVHDGLHRGLNLTESRSAS